jgi:hypothetical protein
MPGIAGSWVLLVPENGVEPDTAPGGGLCRVTNVGKSCVSRHRKEQDPKKLHELIREINDLLEAKEARLKNIPHK